MPTFEQNLVGLILETFFAFVTTFSIYTFVVFFKVMIKRDLMLFFTNLITIGYLS
jgi:hypothetical protein